MATPNNHPAPYSEDALEEAIINLNIGILFYLGFLGSCFAITSTGAFFLQKQGAHERRSIPAQSNTSQT